MWLWVTRSQPGVVISRFIGVSLMSSLHWGTWPKAGGGGWHLLITQ